MPTRTLFIGAHPDDCDFSCGGTAALLRQRGDAVKFVSITNGDKGHFWPQYIADPAQLAARRLEEARRAVEVIGAEFECVGARDGEVYVDQPTTERLVRIIRSYQPDLVICNRPTDYHRDHRYGAQMVLDTTYMLTVPMLCPDVPHLERMPVFAYWYDGFHEGGEFRPDVVVPIDAVMETKVEIGVQHESQIFEWLPYNAGTLAEVPPDAAGRRDFARQRMQARGARVREGCAARIEAARMPAGEYTEAFQVSEYGRRPSPEELVTLFPV